MGNVFLLPQRGLCCLAGWVFVTFDFRILTHASSNEQKPNPTETSPGGPAVSEAQRGSCSTEFFSLDSCLLPARLFRVLLLGLRPHWYFTLNIKKNTLVSYIFEMNRSLPY